MKTENILHRIFFDENKHWEAFDGEASKEVPKFGDCTNIKKGFKLLVCETCSQSEEILLSVLRDFDKMDGGDPEVPPQFSCERCKGEMYPEYYKVVHRYDYRIEDRLGRVKSKSRQERGRNPIPTPFQATEV